MFKGCSQCHSVYYCGATCQRKHWRIHKNECKALAAADFKGILWAARAGHFKAMYDAFLCLLDGRGVTADAAYAILWLIRAAEGGHLRAQVELGIRYMEGDGVPADNVLAVAWITRAAEAGDPHAMHALGMFHRHSRCC